MTKTSLRIRSDGWTLARRTEFLGALRVSGRVGDACAWAGMSTAGAYALAKRDPGFAAAWDAALSARADDWRPATMKPFEELSDGALLRRLSSLDAKLNARPRGIVAQQKLRCR